MPPANRSTTTKSLAGKTAVITGASQGIGLAITEALGEAGASLAIASRNQVRLKAVETNLRKQNAEVIACVTDVSDEASVARLFGEVKKKFGSVEILINNAGIAHQLFEIENLPFASWREVMSTNLDGLFLVTKHALPLMAAGATIVNNLSVAAKQTFDGMAAYAASKHGALGFTNSLRAEAEKRGIRVMALLPGATDTGIWSQFWPDAPRAKMISPATVADAVLHAILLPPEAAITQLNIGPTAGVL